ncbi:hypothetical protein HanXRQr2_Chr11g0508091 [Helianthus annuus]|uniref:Uncharacterized protein n=1 Tax=Helianthus annuus TaxID=4232 RepID=A0A251TD95_HELAN|nr:hypothetical protein HanXRQr2_Chr11g0508091 [Helianthus annuus]KAJ0502771.1 hypothetical protein HanHA300_Chr11g0416711 [Helianthus annuus]KAJ0518731.1 hypothetical protein HanHA89_Chr11g0440741 [Helianthus annuus]
MAVNWEFIHSVYLFLALYLLFVLNKSRSSGALSQLVADFVDHQLVISFVALLFKDFVVLQFYYLEIEQAFGSISLFLSLFLNH